MRQCTRTLAMAVGGLALLGTAACGTDDSMTGTAQASTTADTVALQEEVKAAQAAAAAALLRANEAYELATQANTTADDATRAAQTADAKAQRLYQESLRK